MLIRRLGRFAEVPKATRCRLPPIHGPVRSHRDSARPYAQLGFGTALSEGLSQQRHRRLRPTSQNEARIEAVFGVASRARSMLGAPWSAQQSAGNEPGPRALAVWTHAQHSNRATRPCLGGHGLPLTPGETYDLLFDADGLVIANWRPVTRLPFSEIRQLEISGRGEVKSGGGSSGVASGLRVRSLEWLHSCPAQCRDHIESDGDGPTARSRRRGRVLSLRACYA